MPNNIKTITKFIRITASAERVWEVLFGEEYYPQWAGIFAEGSIAQTDWQEGSKVMFVNRSNSGLHGFIRTNNYPDFLEIEYDGEVVDGRVVTDSAVALQFNRARESYKLKENNGLTMLDVNSDMAEEYYDDMSSSWDEALKKIKDLAESV